MASKYPEINRRISEAINNLPSRDEKLRQTNPERYQQMMAEREIATTEYLERIRQGEIEARIKLQNKV